MSPDDPRHGSTAGAKAHWKAGEESCGPCREAARRHTKAARVDAARGQPRTTTLGRAHEVLVTAPSGQLSRATGMSPAKLSHLRQGGPNLPVHRRTRDRILAAGQQQFWTAVGIQRRARALATIGWSARALSAEIDGVGLSAAHRLLVADDRAFVRREIAEPMVAAYDRLWDTHPEGRGAARARNAARTRGWAPPLAWDDIDNPHEQPQGLRGAADDAAAARVELLEHAIEHGHTIDRVAADLGITRNAVQVWCGRWGYNDLYLALTASTRRSSNSTARRAA